MPGEPSVHAAICWLRRGGHVQAWTGIICSTAQAPSSSSRPVPRWMQTCGRCRLFKTPFLTDMHDTAGLWQTRRLTACGDRLPIPSDNAAGAAVRGSSRIRSHRQSVLVRLKTACTDCIPDAVRLPAPGEPCCVAARHARVAALACLCLCCVCARVLPCADENCC